MPESIPWLTTTPTAGLMKTPTLVVLVLLAICLLSGTPMAGQEIERRTRVVLLGTGTPNAEPDRSGPATAIVVDDVPYLIDAGPGVVRQAMAAQAAGVEGLNAPRLGTVFLTHLHSDHTVGLPDLIFTPWTLGRNAPLVVIGPPGTREMTEHLRAAYSQDIRMRVDGLEPANDVGHRVDASDVRGGLVYEDERVRVTAIPVPHGSWETALGYRFETPDRVIVVSGDTSMSEELADACDGCDVLVHEVFAQSGWERRTPLWQDYHRRFHTSAPDVGRLAARANPDLLVLTHQLLWGATEEELLTEIREQFGGRVVYGRDLDIF